jgi:hypothetical protein
VVVGLAFGACWLGLLGFMGRRFLVLLGDCCHVVVFWILWFLLWGWGLKKLLCVRSDGDNNCAICWDFGALLHNYPFTDTKL